MDRCIRRLTNEEQADAAYREACEEIEAAMRANYEAEFGEEYRAKHPFQPDSARIHKIAMKQIYPTRE